MTKKTPSSESISGFLRSLNEDIEEKIAREHKDSLFDHMPSEHTISDRVRRYDDPVKHLVRKEAWVKTARRLYQAKGSSLRVLTLPGRHRLEVELYLKEGFISPDNGQIYVVGFETSPDVFGLLRTMEPRFLRLYQRDLIEVLSSPGTEEDYKRLAEAFPFDIINLDLTVGIANKTDAPYGPVLQAIRACLKLQGNQTSDWALMLTFRADAQDVNQRTLTDLTENFQTNLEQHPLVKEKCYSRHQTENASEFLAAKPEEALGRFLAKWIADQAFFFEWKVQVCKHIRYDRKYGSGSYPIRKIVLEFTRERLPGYSLPRRNAQATTWLIDGLVSAVAGSVTEDVGEKIDGLRRSKPDYVVLIANEIEELKMRAAGSNGDIVT
jgi:hypothetical protein